MLRRGSTISSAKSVSSSLPNGLPTPGYSRPAAGIAPSIQSAQSTKQTFGFDTLNPDDLFSRYSVSEVKSIQARLRNDADVKQEELRLMVGERYRDLLQASTSIISMAGSSKRVLDAIEECRGAIIAQEEPPMPSRSTTFGGVNDRHLHALQLLSAHVKVLLDAPEHLWRLIERKNYLSAAWLFLFTRVVHRALVHQDDEDENSWSKVGIDVLAEFPLVQRQWDEISTFRSQIIHKSTLSLREVGLSSQAVCATLITLHLLDSRPLREAFAALLTQRTKALTALISWKGYAPSANGRATKRFSSDLDSPTSRRSTPKEILQANEKALTAIIDTVHTSRQIFQIPPDQQTSLISSVLHWIQDEKISTGDSQIPSELVPSTHSLLTNSSSSAHFLLLPATLQAYKPYIDLESSSLIYSQAEFRQVLHDWLHKSTKSWRGASCHWLVELGTVAQIWNIRTSLRSVVSGSQLDDGEKGELADTIDGLCHDRILDVWKVTLEKTQNAFKTELVNFLSSLKEKIEPRTPFQAPSPPTSQASKQVDAVPFHQYQSALKRQLLGRTAQLDAVMSTLEQAARTIQNDLATVLSDKTPEGVAFGKIVTDTYQPLAESTVDTVVSVLEEEAEQALNDSGTSRLVGIANMSDELRSSSIFLTHIGCRKPVLDGVRSRLDSVYDDIVERWRERTVTRIFDSITSPPNPVNTTKRPASGPSPHCFQSLMSLSSALQELGISQHNPRHEPVVQSSLLALIKKYLASDNLAQGEQKLCDIAFLKAISETYGAEWDKTTEALSSKFEAEDIPETKRAEIDRTATDLLVKTQTLLALLLPCSAQVRSAFTSATVTSPSTSKETLASGAGGQSHFLLFGNPSTLAKQEYHPALELAKPSSRFQLLLVSSVDN